MPGRGPYAKGRERREAILAATLEVFAQSGYRGTSLRAIARELGIGSSLIQHYFDTREELLTEVIKAWDGENARLSAGLAADRRVPEQHSTQHEHPRVGAPIHGVRC